MTIINQIARTLLLAAFRCASTDRLRKVLGTLKAYTWTVTSAWADVLPQFGLSCWVWASKTSLASLSCMFSFQPSASTLMPIWRQGHLNFGTWWNTALGLEILAVRLFGEDSKLLPWTRSTMTPTMCSHQPGCSYGLFVSCAAKPPHSCSLPLNATHVWP